MDIKPFDRSDNTMAKILENRTEGGGLRDDRSSGRQNHQESEEELGWELDGQQRWTPRGRRYEKLANDLFPISNSPTAVVASHRTGGTIPQDEQCENSNTGSCPRQRPSQEELERQPPWEPEDHGQWSHEHSRRRRIGVEGETLHGTNVSMEMTIADLTGESEVGDEQTEPSSVGSLSRDQQSQYEQKPRRDSQQESLSTSDLGLDGEKQQCVHRREGHTLAENDVTVAARVAEELRENSTVESSPRENEKNHRKELERRLHKMLEEKRQREFEEQRQWALERQRRVEEEERRRSEGNGYRGDESEKVSTEKQRSQAQQRGHIGADENRDKDILGQEVLDAMGLEVYDLKQSVQAYESCLAELYQTEDKSKWTGPARLLVRQAESACALTLLPISGWVWHRVRALSLGRDFLRCGGESSARLWQASRIPCFMS